MAEEEGKKEKEGCKKKKYILQLQRGVAHFPLCVTIKKKTNQGSLSCPHTQKIPELFPKRF